MKDLMSLCRWFLAFGEGLRVTEDGGITGGWELASRPNHELGAVDYNNTFVAGRIPCLIPSFYTGETVPGQRKDLHKATQ